MDTLLSRFAEDSYWMARYVERAESLARIINVTRSFGQTRDLNANWGPVLDLFEDRQAYRSRFGSITEKNVLRFYLLDKTNGNSIISSINFAHNNARTLRHLISVEMWTLINVFATRLAAMRVRDIAGSKLTTVCEGIKNDCELFQGSTLNTLYRDQVWHFYRFGRLLERCDQTVRLVDIKTRPVTGRGHTPEMVDVSQWHSLLRAASAYHGYLKQHPRELTPQTAAGFVLLDPSFPGSARFCVDELASVIEDLKPYIPAAHYRAVASALRQLKQATRGRPTVPEDKLSDKLKVIQEATEELHKALADMVFLSGA